MNAVDFVHDLLGPGRVRVAEGPAPPARLAEAVAALDAHARASLPGDPPPLVPAVGEWAVRLVYRACQALAFREIGEQAIRDALGEPCPPATGAGPAAVAYSADLGLCVLPDLIRLARATGPDDPLVAELERLGKTWPLSSVGTPKLDVADAGPAADDPGLLRLYADRVIERADLPRLADPRVRAAVRAALGAFPELAPHVAKALSDP